MSTAPETPLISSCLAKNQVEHSCTHGRLDRRGAISARILHEDSGSEGRKDPTLVKAAAGTCSQSKRVVKPRDKPIYKPGTVIEEARVHSI